jgi:hypothetical protein
VGGGSLVRRSRCVCSCLFVAFSFHPPASLANTSDISSLLLPFFLPPFVLRVDCVLYPLRVRGRPVVRGRSGATTHGVNTTTCADVGFSE